MVCSAGCGATRATLTGPLLNAANGSSLDLSKGFLEVSFDGEVTAHGSGLVTLRGGSHTLGSDAILTPQRRSVHRRRSERSVDRPRQCLPDHNIWAGRWGARFSRRRFTPARANLEGALLNAGREAR